MLEGSMSAITTSTGRCPVSGTSTALIRAASSGTGRGLHLYIPN
jgi:hypothetical protein